VKKYSAEYDSEAGDYDQSRFENKAGRHLDYVHKKILRELVGPYNNLILEAGIGTGRFGTWLAKKGFNVVGIDVSKGMLNKCKEKKKALGIDIELIVADVHFLPFKKKSFDTCICVNVMDHLSNTGDFFDQVKGIMNEKGHFIFNFSNMQSIYLPFALVINFKKQALFKKTKINSKWSTLRKISFELNAHNFSINETRGCFVASIIPLGEFITKIIAVINFLSEDSFLKNFSGSIFVKVKSV
jgi:2-polyprenyl-3-methyl-5-hydroxy-6-metoxy-1,4-benzoquinol methylase